MYTTSEQLELIWTAAEFHFSCFLSLFLSLPESLTPALSFSLHLFLRLLLPLGDGIEKMISLVLHLLESFHHFNFLQGCFSAIQEKRKRDKGVRGMRKKREGES